MSDISSRIDNLLSKNNLRRIDLVRGTGINEGTIRNWIKGSVPSAEAAYKVAKYFNVSVEWLITGISENEKDTDTKIVLSEEERALIEIFRHLDDRDKNAVLTLAKSLENQYSATLTKPSIVG